MPRFIVYALVFEVHGLAVDACGSSFYRLHHCCCWSCMWRHLIIDFSLLLLKVWWWMMSLSHLAPLPLSRELIAACRNRKGLDIGGAGSLQPLINHALPSLRGWTDPQRQTGQSKLFNLIEGIGCSVKLYWLMTINNTFHKETAVAEPVHGNHQSVWIACK